MGKDAGIKAWNDAHEYLLKKYYASMTKILTDKLIKEKYGFPRNDYARGFNEGMDAAIKLLKTTTL